MSNDERTETLQADSSMFPMWAKVVICLGLIVGGVLLFKALRRGKAGTAAAAASMLALGAANIRPRRTPTPEPIETTHLEQELQQIAREEPLIPPSQLCRVLRQRALPLKSEQHLARELRKLGLRSQVRTVSGRPERRWYDLSGYVTQE
jgi:hypothetical protein